MSAALDYRDLPPTSAYEDDRAGKVEHKPNVALNWEDLQSRQPPARDWIVPHWIPAEHPTLVAGRGGVGKTLIMQHVGTAVALGRQYLEPIQQRRVLMLAGEDDHDELWRRQVAICSHFRCQLSDLTERFFLHSFFRADMTLATPSFGALQPTALMSELRVMVQDYGASMVIIDNSARVFGGNENDRHAVTTFMAWLAGACNPAAVVLLAHPSKAAGSEFSGSTAWEGAVRSRLYMSDRPPDQAVEDDAPVDDRVRYLSRRKANYSDKDVRRFSLVDGVLIPEEVQTERRGRPSGDFAKDIVRRAVRTLAAKDMFGTNSTASPNYLPKLARQYKLLETLAERAFAGVMRDMLMADELTIKVVGKYEGNRSARKGIVVPDGDKSELDEIPA
jgi:RecA-family ATPase